jgi:hypothetical protein
MKFILWLGCFLLSLSYSQSVDFRYSNIDKESLHAYAIKVASSSTLWLSEQIKTPRTNRYRLFIKYGQSLILKEINNKKWILPNLEFGVKPTDNLLLSGKFFGMHLDKDAPQVIGGGIHYITGENNNWTISFQKSAINGLNDFRLVSTSFNIKKLVHQSFFDMYVDFGANYYISNSYYNPVDLPKKIERDLNHIGLQFLIPFNSLNILISSKVSSENHLIQAALIKGF